MDGFRVRQDAAKSALLVFKAATVMLMVYSDWLALGT